MKVLLKHIREPGAQLSFVNLPKLRSHDILAKTLATSICGTDIHIFDWDKWANSRINPPIIFGHEFSAQVVEIGSQVKNIKEGDFISAESHIVCGKCLQCNTGQAHLCQNIKLRGIDVDGCFAEYVRVDEQSVWKNNKQISPEVASTQEPIGTAVQAVMSIDVKDKNITIFGCGPIGVCISNLCKALGASQIIVVDIVNYRLNMAKSMGAHIILNAQDINIVKEIMSLTDNNGTDIVFEVSGNNIALNQCLKIIRPGGIISLIGLSPTKFPLDFANDIIMKGITIQGISGRKIFESWKQTSEFITSNILDISKLITHSFKFEDFETAFTLLKSGKCGKIILYP